VIIKNICIENDFLSKWNMYAKNRVFESQKE